MSQLIPSRDGFTLDGEPFRIFSGALHYFRVHPGQWRDRLAMVRGMGLNTVETVVPWNFHEVERGAYDFAGMADFEGFLELAAEAGLHAIVRPGPYICAEWDNGGFPSRLLANRDLRWRCRDRAFLDEVELWFDELIPRIAAHQITRGGNVLLVQVENEYGSFGNDAEYLELIASGLTERGIDVPLFTSDGPTPFMLSGGAVDGAIATVNFGSRATEAFATQREVRPDANEPLFCMEYWNGWFDHWGETHHTRPAAEAAAGLDEILENGASVNLYMAHGGTNFGSWAGSNFTDEGGIQPTVTSYDYDAPIDERGAPTAKFWAFREVLGKYTALPPAPSSEPAPTLPPGSVELTSSVPLLETISTDAISSAAPLTMEEIGQRHGLVLYRSRIEGPREALPLSVDGLADRATVFVDGTEIAVLDRNGTTSVDMPAIPAEGVRVEILVEAWGRINYGPRMWDPKGIVAGVRHGQQWLFGWETTPIPLEDVSTLPFDRPGSAPGPVFHRGRLPVEEPADAFLALPGRGRGFVWVNGFNLGRFSSAGPQRTLYVPAPVLVAGDNEIIVLELDSTVRTTAPLEIRDSPELGAP